MKISIVILMFSLINLYADEALYRVDVDGLIGYINVNGEVLIQPKFEVAQSFADGLAYVYDGVDHCFISKNGESVFKIKSAFGILHVDYFSEELCMVRTGRGICYYNKAGNLAFDKMFEDGEGFSCGVANVKLDNKWGYVNREGTFVITNQYEQAHPFSDGIAHVSTNGKWGIIDQAGRWLVEPKYQGVVRGHSRAFSVVAYNLKWHFVDYQGNEVVSNAYDAAFCFTEGKASVKINGKWGYIGVNGDIVIPAKFDFAREFHEGRGAVEINNKWGYIDSYGNMVAGPRFDEADNFKHGLAQIGIDFTYGYIDKNGKVVWFPSKEPSLKYSK